MKLSTLLPYTCIASDCILSLKKNRITAILEMHVSTVESDENMQVMHDRVMKLITDFPEESIVSVYYTKTFIKQTIPFVNSHKNDIINYLEKKRNQTLLGKNPTTHKCFMSISIPLTEGKSNKGGVDIINKLVNNKQDFNNLDQQRDIVKRAAKRLDLIVTGFSNAIDNRAFRLKSEQIAQFLSLILNHAFLDQFTEFSDVFKSDFISSYNKLIDTNKHGYVYYGGNYHAVLSLRAYGEESSLPTNSSPEINQVFLKERLKDIPYTIHHVIQMPSRDKSIKIAKGRKNRIEVQSAFAKNISFLAKTPEGIPPKELKEMIGESIDIIESTGQRFLFQQYQIHLWSDSLKDLEEKIEFLKSNTKDCLMLKVEKYNIKGAFFSLFPGYEDTNPIKMMIPSYNVSDFLPIDMPRYCYSDSKSENFIYYYTKEDQLTKLDLFDDRATNWNGMVFGSAGTGKSFLVNDILCQYSVYNPQIAIVDYGGVDAGSYRNFIRNNKGTYLEINLESQDFSINPFNGAYFVKIYKDIHGRDVKEPDINGEPDKFKSLSLLATIDRMVSNNTNPELPKVLQSELFILLSKYYKDKKNNFDNSCNINEFAQKYLKDNSTIITTGRDLYKELFLFIGEGENEGPYARFFKKTSEIKSRDFICFDMAGLKENQQLKTVLIPALLEMISTDIIGSSEYERKKLLVIDEAWNDLKGGNMKEFMETMFRCVRKLNGNITIITQNFLDVLNSTIGEALLTNTSYYWFIGNRHKEEPLLRAEAGNLRLSKYDIETIRTCKSKRDFYLLTPFFSGLLKFYPSKEFAVLATTNAEEKNKIREHRHRLGVEFVTPEVIESFLSENKFF